MNVEKKLMGKSSHFYNGCGEGLYDEDKTDPYLKRVREHGLHKVKIGETYIHDRCLRIDRPGGCTYILVLTSQVTVGFQPICANKIVSYYTQLLTVRVLCVHGWDGMN